MSSLIVGLVLSAASGIVMDAQQTDADAEKSCDRAYCQYVHDQSDPKVQEALKGFSQFSRPDFVDPDIVQSGSKTKCLDYSCSKLMPADRVGRHYRVESGNTILNTVLGGAVGALAGGNAFDAPGAIGFGLLGATLGNRDSSLEKSELKSKREKAIRARERSLNNFNDMLYDPSAPIPIDAHYLGDRRRKDKK